MKISACMIVRDEAQFLANSLAEARSWCDELLVLDLGSRDGSPEIAVRYADVLIRKKPRVLVEKGFAWARNYIAGFATGDWIYCVDADEMLSEEQRPEVRRRLETPGDMTALNLRVMTFQRSNLPANDWVRIANSSGWDHGRHVRIYKAGAGYMWRGYIHEELFHPRRVGEGADWLRAFDTAELTEFKHLHFTNYRTASNDAKQMRFAKMLLRAFEEPALREGMSQWWFDNWYPSNIELVRIRAAEYDRLVEQVDPLEFVPQGTPLPRSAVASRPKVRDAKKRRRRVY